MKKWFDVEITRLVVNNKDETTRRNTQHCVVWGKEAEVVGIAFRRCPDPFADEDRRRATFVNTTELRENEDMQGRTMVYAEDLEETQPGLSGAALIKLIGGGAQA